MRRGTLAAASLGFAVIQLDVFVVNVAVRQIGAALGGGTSALQWVVGAYTLLFAALILTAGALGDRFGARRVYSIGFGVFVAASVACGLAPDIVVLVAARAVQGAGAALLGACSLALISHAFTEPAERARAIGYWAAGASVALAAGPIVGGLLIAAVGWRAIFFINVPIGAAGLFLTRRYAAETVPGEHRIDVPGQLAIVVAMTALAGGLIEGGRAGFANPFVLAALGLAAAALGAFVRIEDRSPNPMLPLELLLMAAGCAGMLFVGRSTSFAATVAPQVALSGGLGVVVPLMTSALMGSVDRSRSGVASGTLNSARQAGSVLGVAIFGSLVARGHFIPGFHAALVVSIGLVAAGIAICGRAGIFAS